MEWGGTQSKRKQENLKKKINKKNETKEEAINKMAKLNLYASSIIINV